jgi:hypothetical protein
VNASTNESESSPETKSATETGRRIPKELIGPPRLPLRPVIQEDDDDDELTEFEPRREATLVERMILPIGVSGYALVAGYLGLFSIIPSIGPLALIFALLAMRDLKKRPQLHGWARVIVGLVMGIFGTVLTAIVFLPLLIGR